MNIDSTIITSAFIFLLMYYFYIAMLAVSNKPPICDDLEDGYYRFIFMIPCRNEEKVIGVTIKRLLELDYPVEKILVVNDGSTDETERVVNSFIRRHGDRIEVVNTEDPGRGKGEALNFGFRKLIEQLRINDISNYEQYLVCIIDADGQPSGNICRAVIPFFQDSKVGAVQCAVKIANADSNLVAACQDVEFIGFSHSIQRGRDSLGSVGLGGNGQFTRLSALCSLSLENPWNQCLTEDLDLGLRIITSGWRVRFCPNAYVSQQGVEKIRPLIIQRVRWMQGHYTCWKYLPSILRDGNLPIKTRIDNSLYLILGATPFVVFVSLLFSFMSMIGVISVSNSLLSALQRTNFVLYIIVFYALSFFVSIILVTYYISHTRVSFLRLFWMYHLFAIYTLMWIPASFGALRNIIKGERVWVKTGRTEIEEFVELRTHPRVSTSRELKLKTGTFFLDATLKDLSSGGAGIRMNLDYYKRNAKEILLSGNTIDVIAPETGKPVKSEIVWVAFLGLKEVRIGLQFIEPPTVNVNDDFGYEELYPPEAEKVKSDA